MEFPALSRVGLDRTFSQLGQDIFLPQGLFYWMGRAKKEGKPGMNGTIGSAFVEHSLLDPDAGDEFVIAHLPEAAQAFPGIDPADVFAYAPICGVPAFREAWRNWIVFKGGEEYADVKDHLTLPIVAPGITGAISLCARLFLNPGEQIICPVQRWANYDTVIKTNAGVGFAEYQHFAGEQFNVDGFIATVDQTLQKQQRAVAILNFPNNPTGYNPTPQLIQEELLPRISELLEQHDKPLVILFDDAYEGYAYDDDSMRVSAFYEFVDIDDRLIPVKLDGLSKEMLWYGGRVGCITFGVCEEWLGEVSLEDLSKDLDNKIGALIRGTVSNSPRVVQTVAANLLQDPQKIITQRQPTVDALKRRFVALQDAMQQLPASVKPDPYQGGFFLFLNLDPGIDATAVAEHMLVNHGVTVVPASKPDKNVNGLRLAYCGIEESKIPAVMAAVRDAVEQVGTGA